MSYNKIYLLFAAINNNCKNLLIETILLSAITNCDRYIKCN